MHTSQHCLPHTQERPRIRAHVRLAALVSIALLAGCPLTQAINRLPATAEDIAGDTVATLNGAIDALERNSASWQTVLEDAISKLSEEAQSTVRNEISNLLNRSIAATGTELRCDIDFIGTRVRQALQRIRARLLNQTVPLPEPALCQVVPPAIDMALDPNRRNKVEFFGYDFDTTPITVRLHDRGRTLDVSDKLDRLTHYHMTLNLGANGVPLSSASNRITLEWRGKQISSIPVIQEPTPVCRTRTVRYTRATHLSFTPPHTGMGDTDYKGHGPEVWATAQWRHDDTVVELRLWMKAQETQSDWTTAEGVRVESYYTAPPGWRIDSIVGGGTSSAHYIDTDHNEDRIGGGPSGPVKEFVFRGDRRGNDAGIYTGVDVYFNPLMVELVEARNCTKPSTLRSLRAEGLIAPATLERLVEAEHLHPERLERLELPRADVPRPRD